MRRHAADRNAAPAGAGVVPRALGGRGRTVRPHYEGLPSMADVEQAKAAKAGRMAAPESTAPRT